MPTFRCALGYGTVNQNVKATYVKYLGWFDGNPSTLHPYPPVEGGKKYVEFMGGATAVLAKARRSYEQGDYRWVAEVVKHVVFSEPHDREARHLLADAYEQLGYQAESGPWRNFYLSGARELRDGVKKVKGDSSASDSAVEAMPLDMFFDLLAVRLNGPKAAGRRITVNWVFTDTQERYCLRLENCTLNHTAGVLAGKPDVTVTLTRESLNRLALKQSTFRKEEAEGHLRVKGKKLKLHELFALMDEFEFWFNIVTPRENIMKHYE